MRRTDRFNGSWAAALCTAFTLLATTGCSMGRLHLDLLEARKLGLISGPVATPDGTTDNVIVALFRQTPEGTVLEDADRLTSTVGSYAFIVTAKQPYLVVAFQDEDGDLFPDPEEASALYGHPEAIVVEPEEIRENRWVHLHRENEVTHLGIDFDGLRQATFDTMPIAAGKIASLDDSIFSPENAKAGMWSPLTSVREIGGGVFFLEPYDPTRIPVLFVHGLAGSPRDFRTLIESLDRTRFQAWVYQYPSGVRLERAGSLLSGLLIALQEEMGFERLFLTAHSMGGLVTRSALAQLGEATEGFSIDLFVTFSTPWNGHKGAARGVKFGPVVVPCWIDMQPNSDFIEALKTELPHDPVHHLFFSFFTNNRPLMLLSNDSVITVASQLDAWYQERAARTYGFDLDHVGILVDEQANRTYQKILNRASEGAL